MKKINFFSNIVFYYIFSRYFKFSLKELMVSEPPLLEKIAKVGKMQNEGMEENPLPQLSYMLFLGLCFGYKIQSIKEHGGT